MLSSFNSVRYWYSNKLLPGNFELFSKKKIIYLFLNQNNGFSQKKICLHFGKSQ